MKRTRSRSLGRSLLAAALVVVAPAIAAGEAGAEPRDGPFVEAGPSGFLARSADGTFRVRIGGYVQMDGRHFVDDEAGVAGSGFLLRRVRPILAGTVFGRFEFRLMPEFGEGKTGLQDGWIAWQASRFLRVRAGRFKPPVGLERLQSATDILFAERAFPTGLVPNRDVGVQAEGRSKAGVWEWAAGVFNGVPDGAAADVDAGDGKDLAARVVARPFVRREGSRIRGLGFGLAVTSGTESGRPDAPALPTYKTPGQQTVYRFRSDGTTDGTTVAEGGRRRLSPQAYLYSGRLGALAEYVRTSQRVRLGGTIATLSARAWQLALSWMLTADDASYGRIDPRCPLKAGGWGAWQVALRVAGFDADEDAFPVFADPTRSAHRARAIGVGVNGYLEQGVRVLLDYEQTFFRGGAVLANRPDEKVLIGRFQLAF